MTGLWFISVPGEYEGTQFVFRTKEKITDMRLRNRIHSDIFEFTGHEQCFYITDQSTEDLSYTPVDEWIEENLIYAIYDYERGIG